MGTKEYSDEFDLQIGFLKKMKDNISDKSIIENLDKVIGNIYEHAITRFDPAVRIQEEDKRLQEVDKKKQEEEKVAKATIEKAKQDKVASDLILNSLSNASAKEQRTYRIFGYLNLAGIVVIIIIFAILIYISYYDTNKLLKSYLIPENTKNEILDSLSEKDRQTQLKLLDRIDSFSNQIIKVKPLKLTAQDAATLAHLDSIKSTLKKVKASSMKLESKTSNFAKVQPLIYSYIILNISFLLAIIAVSIYLIRVLVNIHRYNNIFADHYNALDSAYSTMKNREVFGANYDLEKAYSLMHPQKDKFIEINAPVDMDPGTIIKDLNEIIAKHSIPKKT